MTGQESRRVNFFKILQQLIAFFFFLILEITFKLKTKSCTLGNMSGPPPLKKIRAFSITFRELRSKMHSLPFRLTYFSRSVNANMSSFLKKTSWEESAL